MESIRKERVTGTFRCCQDETIWQNLDNRCGRKW